MCGYLTVCLVVHGSISAHPDTSLVYLEQFANQFTKVNTLISLEIECQFASVPV